MVVVECVSENQAHVVPLEAFEGALGTFNDVLARGDPLAVYIVAYDL
jgi:hypothetical protein